MPRRYNRRRYPRRRMPKRLHKEVPWYARKYTVGDMASAALRGVNYIKGLVNAEVYKNDLVVSGASVTSAGTVNNLTAIAQGDGITTRTGNSLFVRSVDINGTFNMNSSSTTAQIGRFWLVLDLQQTADTSPSFSDIFDGNNVNSHLNANTVGRFKILAKRTFVVWPTRPTAILKIRKLMRHHVRFNGTASTDSQKGSIYLVSVSNTSGTDPLTYFNSRVSYHDN